MNVLDNMPMPDVVVRQQPAQASLASANNVNNVNNVQSHQPVGEKQTFLMVSSRDVTEEERELLQLYGKVLDYDNCHVNIPLDQLINQNSADYVVFDVRDKQHRMAISKASVQHDNPNVHVIALVNAWEKEDDFVDDANCENCLSSLPPKQAFKRDFDTLLLQKKIRQPSCTKNLLRLLAKALGGCAKE